LKAHVVHQLPTKDRRAAAGIKIGPISHQAATTNACWISVLRYGFVLLFKLIGGNRSLLADDTLSATT
jgi:hypothetical protein